MSRIRTLQNTPYYELDDGSLVLAVLPVDVNGEPASLGGGSSPDLSGYFLVDGSRAMTGPALLSSGSAGAPGLGFSAAPTWGLYKTSSGIVIRNAHDDISTDGPAERITFTTVRDGVDYGAYFWRGRLFVPAIANYPTINFGTNFGPESSGYRGDGIGQHAGQQYVGIWTNHAVYTWFSPTGTSLHTTASLGWSRNNQNVGENDTNIARHGVGSIAVGAIDNGQLLGLDMLSELTTIAAAANTDTAIQIPAHALVLGVSTRVVAAIPTATTYDAGVAGATTRYGTGISTAINTTHPGTNDGPRYYGSATSIRITPDATPGTNAGRVRVTVHYISITPPTS